MAGGAHAKVADCGRDKTRGVDLDEKKRKRKTIPMCMLSGTVLLVVLVKESERD